MRMSAVYSSTAVTIRPFVISVETAPRLLPGGGRFGGVAGEELVWGNRMDRGLEDRRGRIKTTAGGSERRRLRPPREIGLGQDDPVGVGHLLRRLRVLGQMPGPVDRVDRRHYEANTEVVHRHGLRHQHT